MARTKAPEELREQIADLKATIRELEDENAELQEQFEDYEDRLGEIAELTEVEEGEEEPEGDERELA